MEINYSHFVAVRFETNLKSYNFATNMIDLKLDDQVVVETVKGLELGIVSSDVNEISNYKGKTELKPVIRKASKKDIDNAKYNIESAKKALEICKKEIERFGLDMNLVSSEYALDRSQLSFVYLADERVDFRELLKSLASIFKCRIDLRQIGVRDNAKVVGSIGLCGIETCCSKFMKSFDVISINMAKNQMLSLNAQKLSGQCGKLKCCLKHENQEYTELKKDAPKINSKVIYDGQKYRITSVNLISHMCRLENESQNFMISIDDLNDKGTFN